MPEQKYSVSLAAEATQKKSARPKNQILEVKDINTYYGLSHILFQVSLEMSEGDLACILGRNGVGKTTTLRSIIGLTPPQKGSIRFLGVEIKGKKPYEIARLGMGFVPEDRVIFPDLTVRENLEIAVKKGQGSLIWTPEKAFQLFPILGERANQKGGTLSGGEQQMLTIARTLMGNPRLLLLDEPSEGLAPRIVRSVYEQINLLKKQGMPILLSEQNSSFAMMFSDRVYILEKGHVVWNGNTAELQEKPEIMRQFLGV